MGGISLDGAIGGALVERRRLLDRLAGAAPPLILLQAPAGYGKSVLLAHWAARDPRPFASISLGEAHNDPAILLASLIEAMEPVEPLPAIVASALQAPQPDLTLLTSRVESALRARRVPAVLVLDELEHLHSAASLALVEAIIDGIEDGFQLAIATRGRGLPHGSRLQASHRLLVIDGAELVMTPGEGRQLLAQAGLETSERDLRALMERTEGWPAALYLASLSLRGWAGSTKSISSFAGDERRLADYMREELLAQVPAADLEFLRKVSFLDRLSGELCDAVLEREGSAAKLAELARGNMLLMPLDPRDEWFRMHSLLGDMLRTELRRHHPRQIDALNLRASAWWARREDLSRAISFAIDGQDLERAGELLWSAVPAYMASGRYATIERWLERIGPERLSSDPHLTITLAHGHLSRGEGAASEHWAGITRRLLEADAIADVTVAAGLAMIDGTLARDGVASMWAAASRAQDALPEESPWLSMSSLLGGIAAQLELDRERARALLSAAARRSSIWNLPILQVVALGQLALLASEEGDRQSASILASQARAQVERSGLMTYPSMALPLSASAFVRATERRGAEARVDLRHAQELISRLDGFGSWYEAECHTTLAAAWLALDEPAAARRELEEARARGAELSDAPLIEAQIGGLSSRLGTLAESGAEELTPAELRVLRLLPTHLSLPQIAADLFVSPNTVKTQARAAYRKLEVNSRSEAVDRSRALGLLAKREIEPEANPAAAAICGRRSA